MGAVFRQVLEADPATPSLLRRSFRKWLQRLAWPSDQADDLVIALNEAASNVVEHAYQSQSSDPDGDRMVRVRAEQLAAGNGLQRVLIEVADAGRWRPPPADPGYRGRGLRMIRACTAHTSITHSPTGTTVSMLSHPSARTELTGTRLPHIPTQRGLATRRVGTCPSAPLAGRKGD